MKKTYIAPAMQVANMDSDQIICTSALGYGEKQQNGVAESRYRMEDGDYDEPEYGDLW